MPSDQPLPLCNETKTTTSLEQLLAETAQFETLGHSSIPIVNGWDDSSTTANGLLDDELMSLWMAAPTDFT
jgi:hypothetical protein